MLGQVIHRHWVDRIRELEAEYLGVEGSSSSKRSTDVLGSRKPVALAGKQQVAMRHLSLAQ